MWTAAISIFPRMFDALTGGDGVVGRAIARDLLSFRVIDPRDHADDRHATVDDRPYGGGPGMVMKAEPLTRALNEARAVAPGPVTTVFLSPQGRKFDHRVASELARMDCLVFVAGRYEGVDERFVHREVDLELSLGDFVLSGGELAVMVVLDAVARLLPGTLGNAESVDAESHVDGLLDHPHFTRPARFGDEAVPEVLLGGDHGAVARWRRKEALGRTWQKRPDLLAARQLDADDRRLLREFIADASVHAAIDAPINAPTDAPIADTME